MLLNYIECKRLCLSCILQKGQKKKKKEEKEKGKEAVSFITSVAGLQQAIKCRDPPSIIIPITINKHHRKVYV